MKKMIIIVLPIQEKLKCQLVFPKASHQLTVWDGVPYHRVLVKPDLLLHRLQKPGEAYIYSHYDELIERNPTAYILYML